MAGPGLMAALARLAVHRGCRFIGLAVEPDNRARRFYQRIGMHQHEGWLPYRTHEEAMRSLASEP
jgi:hypothetical protein